MSEPGKASVPRWDHCLGVSGAVGSVGIAGKPEKANGIGQKVASALSDAFIVTLQLPAPLQSPPQAPNIQPPAGVAVNVTWDPALKLALQVAPQSIPEGELATLPPELPITETESA